MGPEIDEKKYTASDTSLNPAPYLAYTYYPYYFDSLTKNRKRLVANNNMRF